MSRIEVMLWAKRICARRSAEAYLMLEVPADASLEIAQQAFHRIARMAHPDLHRTTCTAEELELVTSAFALVAAAYQQFRSMRLQTTQMASMRDVFPSVPAAPKPDAGASDFSSEAPSKTTSVSEKMTPRAAIHYRKAMQSLRTGDLRAGALHMKMAIASDPQSKFLRAALAQLEVELAKKP